MGDVSAEELAQEKKLGFCAKLYNKAWHAAFGSVMVPAFAFVDNSALAKLHKFILLCIVFIIGMMVIGGRKYYLEVIPNAYSLWVTGKDASFATLISTQQSSSDFCNGSENNKYAWFKSGRGIDFSAKDFSCVNSSWFEDDELPRAAANGEAFFPTYFSEAWEERKVTTSDCTALQSSCVPGGQGASDWDNNVSGAKQFVDLGLVGGQGTCKCETRPSSFFTTGIEEKIVYLKHSMTADASGQPLTSGVAGLTKEEAAENEAEPVLTIVQYFDTDEEIWK